MVNWGAFSRDFSQAFSSTYRAVSDATDRRARTELARNADARAQRSADRADADDDSYEKFMGLAYGESGPADKVAPASAPPPASGIPAPPNKFGGPKPPADATPAAAPATAVDPAADEAAEVAAAQERGFEPTAPPAARTPTQVGRRTADEVFEATRAAGIKITPKIAAEIERMRDSERQDKQLAISGRGVAVQEGQLANQTRQLDDNLKTSDLERQRTRLTLNKETFEQAKAAGDQLYQQLEAKIGTLELPDETPLVDPTHRNEIKSVIDDLERFHKATPDGKSIQVNRKDNGYEVIEVDDETGKPISENFYTKLGDLKRQAQMAGQIAKGANLPNYLAATQLDNVMRKSRAAIERKGIQDNELAARQSEVNVETQNLLKQVHDLTPAQLADPRVREEIESKVLSMSALNPDVMLGPPRTEEFTDEEGNKQKRTVRDNPVLNALRLKTPSETAPYVDSKTGETKEIPIQTALKSVLDNAAVYVKQAGSLEAALPVIGQKLIDKGYDPGLVEYWIPKLGQAIAERTAQTAAQAATPRTPSAVQAPVAPRGLPTPGPVNPRNPSMGQPRIDPATGQPVRNRAGLPITN